MLILSRKVNESIILSGTIEVKVLEVKGERVKLGISGAIDAQVLEVMGERVKLGISDLIEVEVLEVMGERVKLGITAPADVTILRRELVKQIDAEDVAAAGSSAPEASDAAASLGRVSKATR